MRVDGPPLPVSAARELAGVASTSDVGAPRAAPLREEQVRSLTPTHTNRELRDDPRVPTMDEYLDGLPAAQRATLVRVRAVVTKLVPEAEEGVSYGMPAFIYEGRPLLGFRAATQHLSVFPFSPAAIASVEDRLEGFTLSKGTIRFTPENPVPEKVLADVVRARQQEITPNG